MSQSDGRSPVLLVKKAAGMLLLVVGSALTAAGFGTGYTSLAMSGMALLAIGVLLLVLKIMRRNEGRL